MPYIKRAIEPLLIRKYQTYKSVAVTGARQVGKTRMTKELFPSVRRINLKNPNLLSAANDDPQGFMESFDRPLFIDEVQECPKLLGSAKVILDNVDGYGNYFFPVSRRKAKSTSSSKKMEFYIPWKSKRRATLPQATRKHLPY